MIEKYELIHHKDFHKIQLQGLKLKERSIFMALSYKAMHQETDLLEFDVNEIAYLANFNQQSGENIYAYLRKTYKSIKNITIQVDKENGFKDFVLFTRMESFEDRGVIEIKVNEDYRYLLNKIVSPYTIQNLLEYNQLSSKYSQLAYSFLKEWEGTKDKILTIEEFKQKLGVPKTYRMSEIDKFVITPIMNELIEHFKYLKIEKVKTGKSITHIHFIWKKDTKALPPSKKEENSNEQQKVESAFQKEFDEYCEKYFDNTKLKKIYNIKFAKALYVKYRNNPKIIPNEKLDIDVFSFLFEFDNLEKKS